MIIDNKNSKLPLTSALLPQGYNLLFLIDSLTHSLYHFNYSYLTAKHCPQQSERPTATEAQNPKSSSE